MIEKRLKSVEREARKRLRTDNIRYRSLRANRDRQLIARFNEEPVRQQALSVLRREYGNQFLFTTEKEEQSYIIKGIMREEAIIEIENYAVSQNLVTLRNRVDAIGVSEPIIQRQGRNRIVIELPGVQDTATAKRIIGKTANLEFRLEANRGQSSERFQFCMK